jgi:hypothetical protein
MARPSTATGPTPSPTGLNGRDRRSSTPDAPASPAADPGSLGATHTPNFPALLRQLGASLLVTSYQAGKLVRVRDEGDHLNTHYRAFKALMGLALAGGSARLAIGTTIVGISLVLRNVWVWLHWEVLPQPRRGGRRIVLNQLPFRAMLSWLQNLTEKLLVPHDGIYAQRPMPT